MHVPVCFFNFFEKRQITGGGSGVPACCMSRDDGVCGTARLHI
jgi:hypothetical protein